MKSIQEMTQAEVAALINAHLQNLGIHVVLSGGAVVGIYGNDQYVSKDIDFVNARFTSMDKIESAMNEIGFHRVGRHFKHPDSDQVIEFPPGPLTIGDEMPGEPVEIVYETGRLHLISPTDCVKDRLAHYYHWGDRQCLAQAILVAKNQPVDLYDIETWSENEGKQTEFEAIKSNFES